MAAKALPPQTVLDQLFAYEPETGKFFWKERPPSMFRDGKQSAQHNAAIWNAKNAGSEAFTTKLPGGYCYTTVHRQKVFAHRVAWKLAYGDEPTTIDHINGDPSDNRIANLRAASSVDNGRNMQRSKANNSGVTGVSWDQRRARWYARIHVEYRGIFLGYFDTFDEAVAARKAAEVHYGFHPNHGRD